MYICLCKGITDKQIQEAMAKKKGRPVKEILESLGVGQDCGTCIVEAIQDFSTQAAKQPNHCSTHPTSKSPT